MKTAAQNGGTVSEGDFGGFVRRTALKNLQKSD